MSISNPLKSTHIPKKNMGYYATPQLTEIDAHQIWNLNSVNVLLIDAEENTCWAHHIRLMLNSHPTGVQ